MLLEIGAMEERLFYNVFARKNQDDLDLLYFVHISLLCTHKMENIVK